MMVRIVDREACWHTEHKRKDDSQMAGAAAASHRASTASSATWITHSDELLRSEIHGFINTLLVSIYWVYVDSATAG